jgi:MFS family permease
MAVVVPMFGITLLVPTSLWVVLGTSTLFFVCMSGRMIPCMAMLTSAANPAWRGTFMTINSAVQSASMGIAALVGATASLLAIGVGRKLNLHAPSSPPKA